MSEVTPLELRGVVKRFEDVVAVAGVDLELEPGELLALVGPSGCGKSTLLRSIAGLYGIDAGSIRLGSTLVDDGTDRLPPERRATGLVFQEHALFPHLTVADNIEFGLRDGSAGGRQARVDEMLDLVDLEGYSGRFPHELSGGERQRVALARALAPEPSLMLFDEPFASLDHNLRLQLRQEVAATLRVTGTPAVFVTHDQQEALAIADRVAVMRAGRIVQLDSPAAVYHRPVDRFVGAFMGDASFLPVATDASTVLGPIDLDGHDPDGVVAMVRPDDVGFILDETGPAWITGIEYQGSGWRIRAATGTEGEAGAGAGAGGGDRAEVHVLMDHNMTPSIGDRGRLSLTPGHRQVPVRSEVAPAG
ncbi:MAG: ABC transporter ATP-binding protein [Actinomycetota bacterium]